MSIFVDQCHLDTSIGPISSSNKFESNNRSSMEARPRTVMTNTQNRFDLHFSIVFFLVGGKQVLINSSEEIVSLSRSDFVVSRREQ